jgi:hypothetical protein
VGLLSCVLFFKQELTQSIITVCKSSIGKEINTVWLML